jgi:hypothetical protein
MTNDETVTRLLERLGLTVGAEGEERVAACRSLLANALALEEQLPTSWFEAWDRVSALKKRLQAEPSTA